MKYDFNGRIVSRLERAFDAIALAFTITMHSTYRIPVADWLDKHSSLSLWRIITQFVQYNSAFKLPYLSITISYFSIQFTLSHNNLITINQPHYIHADTIVIVYSHKLVELSHALTFRGVNFLTGVSISRTKEKQTHKKAPVIEIDFDEKCCSA